MCDFYYQNTIIIHVIKYDILFNIILACLEPFEFFGSGLDYCGLVFLYLKKLTYFCMRHQKLIFQVGIDQFFSGFLFLGFFLLRPKFHGSLQIGHYYLEE